eukprot:3430978-Rhodomonas_salina.3
MELAHALDDSLAGLIVTGEAERGVLGREADQSLRHLVLLFLARRLHRNLATHFLSQRRAITLASPLSAAASRNTSQLHAVLHNEPHGANQETVRGNGTQVETEGCGRP